MSGKRRVYFTEDPQQNNTQQQPFGVPSAVQSGQAPATQPTYMQPQVPLQPYGQPTPFQMPVQPGVQTPFPQPTAYPPTTQPTTPPPVSEPPTQPFTEQASALPVKHKRVMAIDPEDLSHYDSNTSGAVNQLTNQVGQMSMNAQGVPMQPFTPGQSPQFVQQPTQGQFKTQSMPSTQSSQGEAIPLSIAPQTQCPATYMRMTTNAVANTSNLLTKSNIPLGCVIHPMAQPVTVDDRIPVVNFGISGIVRCRKCRSYINPFVAFLEGGRRWKCNLCSLTNDVPGEYYSPTDASGRRADLNERPELSRGCVEFIAPSEYMVRPPQPPSYFFLIDVSYYSITSGAFYIIVDTIKKTLNEFPGSPRTKVGFITFDSSVHFYNLKSGLTQPQMLVVNDIADMFVPSHADDLLVNLSESKVVVEALLNKLPNMFQGTQNVDNAFGVALKAAFEIVKPIGGKIVCFLSNIPTLGTGKLANREDLKLLGTDKEVQLLNPEDQYYKNFALDCSRLQISVDLYLTASQFMDVATLGTLPQFTGGQLYYYPGFKADRDGEKLFREIRTLITRETGFEAVMRVRTSKGIKVTAHYGNFFIRSTDLLALPNIDSEKAFGVQFNFAESNLTTKYVSIQTALLYTTSSGERRIRVFTQCLPVTSNLGEIFTSADVDAITTLLGKMALDKALTSKLPDAREALVNKCIDILTVYKTDLATNTSGTQLMLPDTLKLMPLYILGLLKSNVFRSATDIRPDERIFYMSALRTMPVALTIPYAYPRLYALHNLPEGVGSVGPEGGIVLPPLVNLSSERIERHGVFLLEDGQNAFLWLGKQVSPEFMLNVFGIPIEHVDPNTIRLPRLENEYSIRVNNIVDAVNASRPNFMTLQIVKEGDAREYKFLQYLVEDKTKTVHSYYEFLVNLHQRIQAKVSKK